MPSEKRDVYGPGPSPFNEDLPARKTSSTESRLVAITELMGKGGRIRRRRNGNISEFSVTRIRGQIKDGGAKRKEKSNRSSVSSSSSFYLFQ